MRTIEYPAWHDKVREDMANGTMKYSQVMQTYNMGSGRVSMTFGVNWKLYLILNSIRPVTARPKSIEDVRPMLPEYQFVPVDVKRIGAKKKYETPIEEYDPMGKPRSFERIRKINKDTGQSQLGAVVRCGVEGCHATKEYFSGSSVNPRYLPQEFAKLGWVVGAGPRADRCPDHAPKKKQSVSIETGHTSNLIPPRDPVVLPDLPVEVWEKVQNMEVAPAAKSSLLEAVVNALSPAKEQPVPEPTIPEPDRMTKRIIHNKLDEVYADEATGYKGEWTDAKVATDLGVSVDWIKQIRADAFGPELNAAIVTEKRGEIQGVAENVERMITLIDGKLDQMQALDAKLVEHEKDMSGLLEQVETALARHKELITNLKTLDSKNEDLVAAFTSDVADFRKLYSEFKAPIV